PTLRSSDLDNATAIESSEVIIISLKPYNVGEVLKGLRSSFNPKKHVLVSVVTGVTLKDLAAIVDHGGPLFRAMPNTAIAIRESVTCIGSVGASKKQTKYVSALFDQLGFNIQLDEKLV